MIWTTTIDCFFLKCLHTKQQLSLIRFTTVKNTSLLWLADTENFICMMRTITDLKSKSFSKPGRKSL